MALHRTVRRPRIVGRDFRSHAEGLDRRVRAVSGTGMTADAATLRATQSVASIPRNDDGPVFREPWQAEAFALALSLNARGLFTWREWAATLGDEIKKAQAAGDLDTGETYYHHWLAALERIVAEKGIAGKSLRRRSGDASQHACA